MGMSCGTRYLRQNTQSRRRAPAGSQNPPHATHALSKSPWPRPSRPRPLPSSGLGLARAQRAEGAERSRSCNFAESLRALAQPGIELPSPRSRGSPGPGLSLSPTGLAMAAAATAANLTPVLPARL